ncbi:fungal-specific transcription factor domain-containing protein [Xylogone sp. PMI_703]|nr:fungal-specific transcription factor domain-containing protein [Xylogone sp. PMI_703]
MLESLKERACDRCYAQKRDCQWSNGTEICSRCARLDLSCSVNRPIRRRGRKPLTGDSSFTAEFGRVRQRVSSASNRKKASIESPDEHFSSSYKRSRRSPLSCLVPHLPMIRQVFVSGSVKLTHAERSLLEYLIHPTQLASYVIGKTFFETKNFGSTTPLVSHFPILKDAYLAVAGALRLSSRNGTTHDTDLITTEAKNLRYAASAIQTLRHLNVNDHSSACLCVILGVLISTFAFSMGEDTSSICRYVLTTVIPVISNASRIASDPETQTWLNMTVFIETISCLSRRAIPTIRVEIVQPDRLDRYIGLTGGLLPILYDVCVASNISRQHSHQLETEVFWNRLDGLNSRLEAWQPPAPPNFLQQVRSEDIVRILAHARVYQWMGLLYIHRLRYPMGSEDGKASYLSTAILKELEQVHTMTGKPLCYVTIPFIAAAAEVTHPSKRIEALDLVETNVEFFAPGMKKKVKDLLLHCWTLRGTSNVSSWFEISSM